VQAFRVELAAVEQTNAVRADDDAEVKQLVAAATDELDRIDQSATVSTQPTTVIAEPSTPQSTPTPPPVSRPTPQPERSGGDRDQTRGER
jgi:hypothetical protein